ncbi:MAG: coiled-coil domain-containing protein 22 [Lachnospiraceae bacterium]|nr:coiled-coil domain-containing protein 22 [Lachnospiraceae bacterium]
MSRTDDIYKPALADVDLPILTLDNNWHRLFTQTGETPEIKRLEKQLNKQLKEQGRVNEEKKKLRAVKRKLMDEIIQLADRYGGSRDKDIEKVMDHHKQMVEECSSRLKALEQDDLGIQEQMKEVNYQLMLRTMEVCYKRLEENQEEIKSCDDWIREMREELRKMVIRKQGSETNTYELYSFMRNIFGRDAINIFDMHYNPNKYRPKKKEEGYIE